MMNTEDETLDLSNPITAEEAVAEFLKDPESERLYRESEIRLEMAEFMRNLRKSQGLTQEKLAERVGCSQPFIAKLEKGAYARFGVANLRTYARALGHDISVQEMFYALSAPIFTGASSSVAVQEAIEYEEQLSSKLATTFARCPVSESDRLSTDNCDDREYDSAA